MRLANTKPYSYEVSIRSNDGERYYFPPLLGLLLLVVLSFLVYDQPGDHLRNP